MPPQKKWSGKRDSNPRLQPWQGCTLPLSYSRSATYISRQNPRACQEEKFRPGSGERPGVGPAQGRVPGAGDLPRTARSTGAITNPRPGQGSPGNWSRPPGYGADRPSGASGMDPHNYRDRGGFRRTEGQVLDYSREPGPWTASPRPFARIAGPCFRQTRQPEGPWPSSSRTGTAGPGEGWPAMAVNFRAAFVGDPPPARPTSSLNPPGRLPLAR